MKNPRLLPAAFGAAAVLALLALLAASPGATSAQPDAAPQAALARAAVQSSADSGQAAFDGVVQAVRQTVIAAQVPGAVVALGVQAGDRVQAGQVLLRLDARAAEQTAAAGAAQVRAARAGLEAATRDFDRQKQLFAQKYISQAALDRAEAQFKSTSADAAAQLASAGAARTQSDFHVIRAPYAGVIAEVAVVLGDMAMPGRPLLTIYDPAALRVSAPIPQMVAARLAPGALPQADIPAASTGRLQPARVHLMPTVDPATHTRELRLDLPAGLTGITPGMFARAWLPEAGGGVQRLYVPARSVLKRAELTGVYVFAADGKPLLRQVRVGRAEGERVEVLSGLAAGEWVALDPQAAARGR
ncbi:MAG: efflux RND transporter periplasmic adaptor subunit [Burkholderiales bacterium]|nr:efflux RND transporter periplasmic adaptor subunit [Burkholderiales bacterium]